MKFEELQRAWQAVKTEPKSHEELRRMMYASPVWRLGGLKRKEILALSGNILTIVVLSIAFDFFGSWDTALLTVWSFVLTLDHYLGLRYLRFIPQKDTLQETLMDMLTHIKQRALISQIVHFLAWIALVLLLGTKVRVGTTNMILWALMLLPLLVAVFWWNSRKWSKKSDEVKALLEELSEVADIPAV
jgi:hypothetical protein